MGIEKLITISMFFYFIRGNCPFNLMWLAFKCKISNTNLLALFGEWFDNIYSRFEKIPRSLYQDESDFRHFDEKWFDIFLKCFSHLIGYYIWLCKADMMDVCEFNAVSQNRQTDWGRCFNNQHCGIWYAWTFRFSPNRYSWGQVNKNVIDLYNYTLISADIILY